MNTFRKISIFALLIALMPISGTQIAAASTWTSGSGLPTPSDYPAIASSDDGVVVAVGSQSGKIWYSSNSGATWSDSNSPELVWRRIAASADGTKMIASARNSFGSAFFIYRSVDSGRTWSAGTQNTDHEWLGVASSGDGTKLAAVGRYACPITSVDSGATWVTRSFTGCSSANLAHLTSDVTGQYLAATTNNSTGIYTSGDFGVTWTQRVVTGGPEWNNIASSADGSKLVATSGNRGVFTSTDRGVTWVNRLPNPAVNQYLGVASDQSGDNLVVGTATELFASNNAGSTWFAQSRSGDWRAIASASTDGTRFVAAKDGAAPNNVFAGTFSFTPPADTTAPVLSSPSASSVTATGATLNFTSNEAGTYYYLVYAAAAAEPLDAATVETQGDAAPTVVKGTSSATASANTVAVTGLTASTSYKAYVIVKDAADNKSTVAQIAFTTAAAAKTSQTITFVAPAAMVVDGTQTVAPTASSGLAVSLYSATTSICTVSGFTITARATGTCQVGAAQVGDSTYATAETILHSFTISSATPTPPTAEQIAAAAAEAEAARVAAEAAAAAVAEAARVAAEAAAAAAAEAARVAAEAAAVEAARVRALAVAQAKTALNNVLAGSSAPTIEQYRAADYTIRTQASFDRITAAVAKLSVSDRQDATKLAALIMEIELDESFFKVSIPPSINIYSDFGVSGVTARTLPTVNLQVLQLPIGERGNVAAIQKIATVENFVDQIANPQTRGSVPNSDFVTRGLVAADNPYKDALIIAAQGLLSKLDETSVDTLEKITAVVARVNAIALKLPVADRTDPSKVAAAIVEEAKTVVSSVLAGSTPPTIEQFRSANYAITTKASFDRITAALAKLPVADRQDPVKLAALVKAIELDESFFNPSARPSLTTYKDYGITGVTAQTLPAVNAQVLLLLAAQRTDVGAIQKIAAVENFVVLIANPLTRSSATASTFVSLGLLAADNPYKESVIAGLKSFDEYSLSTLAKVTAVIKSVNDAVLALPVNDRLNSSSIASVSAKLVSVQTFVNRVSNVQTRRSVRSADFIVRKLMPADTPYKYSVLANLQSYAEDSLNSMEKIEAAIKAEISKALQRRERLSKIKASIASKRR
jgi:hypothetical protein